MMIRTGSPLALIALLTAGASPGLAQAQAGHDEAGVTVAIETQAGGGVFGAQAVSETTLQQIAGREDTAQISQADLKAGVANNSVGDHSVTGAAQIDGNAFQNMSGLSILNVNTGNNVAINAAMNVNISISPAP